MGFEITDGNTFLTASNWYGHDDTQFHRLTQIFVHDGNEFKLVRGGVIVKSFSPLSVTPAVRMVQQGNTSSIDPLQCDIPYIFDTSWEMDWEPTGHALEVSWSFSGSGVITPTGENYLYSSSIRTSTYTISGYAQTGSGGDTGYVQALIKLKRTSDNAVVNARSASVASDMMRVCL